jgi:hypothetical protein
MNMNNCCSTALLKIERGGGSLGWCGGWVWVKGIVSQTDKRWSSVEMVGSESRYDKYFFKYANIYLHI